MTSDAIVWNGFSRAALDAAYNNTAAVSHAAETLGDLTDRSVRTRATRAVALNQPYGSLPRQKIDIFASGIPNAPLFVFLHGGYWQRNSKDMFSAVADGPLAAGFDVALVGYTLAPDASLTAIVAEVATAIRFLKREGPRWKIDAGLILAGGWSAGGHLAALMLELDEVDGALPISGVFDLEPIRHSYLNEKLALDAEEASVESPIHRLEHARKPVCIAYGLAELPELQRQSRMYAAARIAASLPTIHLPLAGKNHFSILPELLSAEGALVSALKSLAILCDQNQT